VEKLHDEAQFDYYNTGAEQALVSAEVDEWTVVI
jgi:hypothetical protein